MSGQGFGVCNCLCRDDDCIKEKVRDMYPPQQHLFGGSIQMLFLNNYQNIWQACLPNAISEFWFSFPKLNRARCNDRPHRSGTVLENRSIRIHSCACAPGSRDQHVPVLHTIQIGLNSLFFNCCGQTGARSNMSDPCFQFSPVDGKMSNHFEVILDNIM